MNLPWILPPLVLGVVLLASCWASHVVTSARRALHEAGDRWQQGYDTGRRVGWYEAADQLYKDIYVLRDSQDEGDSDDWVDGWEDAYRRLNTYWDDIDKGGVSAPQPMENDHTAAEPAPE